MTSKIEIIKQLLQQKELKATPTRVEFLRLLQSKNPSAVTFSMIQKFCKSADRVTLYRTIQTFIDNGVIHKAHQSEEETYYALCSHNCSSEAHFHNHLHFKCTSCKQVTCEHLTEEVKIVLPNFKIHKVGIDVEGTCSSCQ